MDNLPTVIMEVMAILPVFWTRTGGICEMIAENETGFLVQLEDAMVPGAMKITNDRSGRNLGKLAMSARKTFSIQKNARDLCALLNVHRATKWEPVQSRGVETSLAV
jgi:glycosyltransferase involved in cell wall biosynthesis